MGWFVSTAHAESNWFYPGRGDQIEAFEPDGSVDGGLVGGHPVERTDGILARLEDEGALAGLTEIASVTPLRGNQGVVLIKVRPGTDEIALSRRLHSMPGVRWAHPDFRVQLLPESVPNDPYFPDQWHLQNTGQWGTAPGLDIRAPEAWDVSTGAGAIIAIIDTGVDLTHPDLRVIAGHDYIADDDDPSPEHDDPNGDPHGTSTSGLAAAIGNNGLGVTGVAYDAQVYAIRLIGGMTYPGTTYSDVYDSFVEAVDAGAWVLSNSWGYSEGCPDVPLYGSEQDAFDYAETMGRGGLGSVVVFSAGNGACNMSNNDMLAYPTIVGVSAVNGNDDLEGYSSYGDNVDVAAPAGLVTTDIQGDLGYWPWESDNNYTGPFYGTSASCPVVAGVAALMLSANPRLTAADLREVLCETAERNDIPDGHFDWTGWSPYYGCGRVDAAAAVWAVQSSPPTAPALVSPVAQTYDDRVVLRWSAATDPDGEALDYEVTWSTAEAGPTTARTRDLELDIGDAVFAGDTVTWSVRAFDPWGPGDDSPTGIFTVLSTERPTLDDTASDDTASDVADSGSKTSGCNCSVGQAGPTGARGPAFGLLFATPFVLVRRRTRPRGA